MSEILVAKNITKIYGIGTSHTFEALHGVSMTMNEGEFICVMGPSGAGKSTFINNLSTIAVSYTHLTLPTTSRRQRQMCIRDRSTIDIPTKGKVFINDTEVRSMGENEIGKFRYENLGFIFQEFNLLDSLTILENIAVPLSLANLPQEEIEARVKETASRLSIDSLLHKYPNECSGGQRQRAAICRALVTHPKLIVADEPTGNLDSHTSHEILEIFKELNDQDGVSILMVTHDPMIASYSQKLLYIKDGVIAKQVVKGDLTQKEYFHKIVDVNSAESMSLFEGE